MPLPFPADKLLSHSTGTCLHLLYYKKYRIEHNAGVLIVFFKQHVTFHPFGQKSSVLMIIHAMDFSLFLTVFLSFSIALIDEIPAQCRSAEAQQEDLVDKMCDSIQSVAVIQRGRFPAQSNRSDSRERQMGEREATHGRRSRARRGGVRRKWERRGG